MDMKRILQAMDEVSTKPVEGANDMKKFLQVMTEGANPHKVSLPVQMAMQHYQKPKEEPTRPVGRELTISKYFHRVEEELAEQKTEKQQIIKQYSQTIAERVLMKESASKKLAEHEIPGHSMGFTGGIGPGMQDYVVDEAPLDFDKENPASSTIYGHKSNPGSIEYRIMRARTQLKDLAERAQSNELIVWEGISRQFPELAMNIEEIRHGIEELAKIRKGGGRRVHNIPKEIGEAVLAPIKPATPKAIKPKKKTSVCRTGQVQTGMQTKDGKLVPKCSIK